MLTLILLLPLLGALGLLFVPREQEERIRTAAFLVALAAFLLTMLVWAGFGTTSKDAQGFGFVQKIPWIRALQPEADGASRPIIHFYVGVDGISLLLLVLTTFLSAIAILSSWTAITERVKEYMICLLLLEFAMVGVFIALDLFLFYVFWEAMLVPMYLLIGVWGGERRIYAAIKFVLFTMVGSLLMLVAILWLYYQNQPPSFDLVQLYGTSLPRSAQMWLFLAFGLAFAIKVPIFPLHTWLPDAHVEAPTAGSVLLAGVLLKMGTYGFLRFCLPLFPAASLSFAPLLGGLALVGIIYGALAAMAQPDVKKLVAYSSVSHLGFVMLGLFVFNLPGLQGGALQMINHGLSTGALFLIVGMLYERRHTRKIADYGGLWGVMPLFARLFLIVVLSSLALPGLNGFVGEWLVLVGASKVSLAWTAGAASGMVLAAIYLLWMFQRVMFGAVTNPENANLRDLDVREKWCLVPIVVLIFWIGLYPKPFLKTTEPAVQQILERVDQARSLETAGGPRVSGADAVHRFR